MFKPEAFIENLKYMGLEMLGIFLEIAVIAIITIILNKVFKA